MKTIISFYNPKLVFYFVYMLQQVEYEPNKFVDWISRLLAQNKTLTSVNNRQKLVFTKRAKILIVASYLFMATVTIVSLLLLSGIFEWWILLVVLFVLMPQLIGIFLWFSARLAYKFIVVPQRTRLVAQASKVFQETKATKIAVLGSYGKTSMKELLNTVLSESYKVAATPGNMNVSVSHAKFAKTLSGDEEIIIVEFGEGEPGDIKRMAEMLKPEYAFITGLAPNHLDHYPNIDSVATDLLEIYNYVDPDKVFVNGESEMLSTYLPNDAKKYTKSGFGGWKTSDVKINPNKLEFSLKKSNETIEAKSGLIGEYQIAPISAAAHLAFTLGAPVSKISAGIAKSVPYQHRMQPRFIHGAWLIDDTYNGNLEGMIAGLELLSKLEAKRRWYVTPGLVDQGNETESVHKKLGQAIAKSNPDIVVLMDNSVRGFIQKSLEINGYKGELRIEPNPLDFYTSIEHLVASGDIVLMQNDWTDNYN